MKPIGLIKVKYGVKHSTNRFGPNSEIAGKLLEVLECNREGDCLCLFSGISGTNLVDIDHRDIAAKSETVNQTKETP